ncbi:MAG: hypothetical protein F6K19_17265 [Cyanothece sp. SIO1E1]|nr:hypothetical protein [Cyanothece sp. SIO1E1]
MSFFNPVEPILRCKQEALDVQDRRGLIHIHWKIGDRQLLSMLYTRIDQVFVVWGWLTALIFLTAQFSTIDWGTQATIWSVLTVLATGTMTLLAWFWVKVENLEWVIYCWAALMLAGVALTDYGIFWGCGQILVCLCPIWLGLSALGYLCTGIGMRSRTFIIAALIHVVAIPVLALVPGLQFLTTGIVMAGSLLLLAEVQWDMRPPVESSVLSAEQNQFNRAQHQLRQLGKAAYENI